MRRHLISAAAIASVGLGAVAVSSWASTSVPAATWTHSKVTQMTWIGSHPDTSADAPVGKQKVYVINVKENTIKYLGIKPDNQVKLPAATVGITTADPSAATTTWTQERLNQVVARSAVPMAVVFDEQGKVLNVVALRRIDQPRG